MMAERFVRIAGWGKYLPERVMRNAELAELVDTSDEWIRARTGIGERRIAAPEETTCSLAVNAARAALDRAQVRPEDLELIVVATCTPDYASMPATASLVQNALGAPRAGAFDLNAVCSGFLYGLATGSQFILSGMYRSVLVVGAEVFTRILDWQDRSTCVLFGDGAGAVVLQPTPEPGGMLSFVLGSDGSGACSLYVPGGGSRRPASHETVDNREHYVKMMGRDVFRFATRVVPDSVLQALEAASLSTDDIDVFIPHQANVRIIDSAAKRLRLESQAVFANVERYGNTSAASIPVALCEAVEQGLIRAGSTVVMSGFGAGLSWGTAVWKWHAEAR
jgi:3-oxoacyl-[acyl-carrier-protein] synthase-3